MRNRVDFIIRRAVPSDSEDLVALLNDVSKETTFTNVDPEVGFWLSADEERDVIVEQEKKKNGVTIVARVRTVPVH